MLTSLGLGLEWGDSLEGELMGGRAQGWANRPPRGRAEEAVLTDAHGVRKVPPRAGLAVLEVVLQQHLA